MDLRRFVGMGMMLALASLLVSCTAETTTTRSTTTTKQSAAIYGPRQTGSNLR